MVGVLLGTPEVPAAPSSPGGDGPVAREPAAPGAPLPVEFGPVERPALEVLVLNNEAPPTSSRRPPAPALTLDALLPFAQHCPRLRELGLCVSAETSVPPKGLRAVLDAVREGYGHDVRLIGGDDALYSDALGAAGTPGETYAGMVRHNVRTIVGALKP